MTPTYPSSRRVTQTAGDARDGAPHAYATRSKRLKVSVVAKSQAATELKRLTSCKRGWRRPISALVDARWWRTVYLATMFVAITAASPGAGLVCGLCVIRTRWAFGVGIFLFVLTVALTAPSGEGA